MNHILKSERKRLIEEKIASDSVVSLEDLVILLDSSESTVRRDLDELEVEGKLRRIHGGAEKVQNLQNEETIQEKSVKNRQAKRQLAERAAAFVQKGQVIFLDAGTTTEQVIDFLPTEGLTVVTNAIHHAVKLVERQIKTIIIGGDIKNSTDASVGPVAVEQLAGLNFDLALMGMNGVDRQFLTTPDMAEAAVKRQVIANSREIYVLADNSKLGSYSFVKVAPVEKVTLITEHSQQAILEQLKEKTKVIEV